MPRRSRNEEHDASGHGSAKPLAPGPRSTSVGLDRLRESLKTSIEDQAKANKAVEELQNVAGSLTTQKARQLWFHRFQVFREVTSGMSAEAISSITPIGKDMELFMVNIINKLTPRGQNRSNEAEGLLTRTTIVKGLQILEGACIFHYPK